MVKRIISKKRREELKAEAKFKAESIERLTLKERVKRIEDYLRQKVTRTEK